MMRLEDIANAYSALTELVEAEVPVQAAITFKKNRAALKDSNDVFQERRHKLFVKLGVEEGTQITVTDENMPKYLKANQELLDTEVDVETFKIPLSALGNKLIISTRQLEDLDCILTDE